MLEEDDELLQNVDEIFVEPPDPNVDSDEDSADEEEGGLICILNGRQLCAPAEIKLVNNDRVGESSSCNESDDNGADHVREPIIPSKLIESNPKTEWIANRLLTKEVAKWIPGDIQPMPRQFPEPDYSKYKDMSPVNLFELFFDENIYQYLAEQTQLYAHF
ncbi:piggyBac transposable element-derived protein 2-like [Anthonomus grandis grandis]|uniref:piggyBac transposable element-derived protein 2-like n=1 Tax=Anthonomus grandis grandis TaxID=2921223 RepID=UPI0021669178|nr:piggyBac transposable element-derived protein 2-like [Anthonomus grandis grandis]